MVIDLSTHLHRIRNSIVCYQGRLKKKALPNLIDIEDAARGSMVQAIQLESYETQVARPQDGQTVIKHKHYYHMFSGAVELA